MKKKGGYGYHAYVPVIVAVVDGKIIGVDITDKMLDEARKRVKEYGWKNVELVLSDVAEYNVPNDVDGIIGLGALTYSPEYDQVTKNGFEALKPGKRFVIFNTKKSERPVRIFAPILLQLLYYTSTNIPIEFYCSAQRIEGGA